VDEVTCVHVAYILHDVASHEQQEFSYSVNLHAVMCMLLNNDLKAIFKYVEFAKTCAQQVTELQLDTTRLVERVFDAFDTVSRANQVERMEYE